MTVKITLKQLKQAYACKDQLKLFKETFGEEVGFKTEAQAIETASIMAQKFDFYWASIYLLSGDYRKAYEEAEVPLWKAHNKAKAPLVKAYLEAKPPLIEAYNKAVAPLLGACEEALAKEFAKCYFNQEEQKKYS